MNELDRQAHAVYKSLPPRFDAAALEQAYALGLLRKEDLTDGALYYGWCRNASQARWDAARSRFVYRRTKFGSSFDEDIVHPVDDEGFDVFAVVAPVAAEAASAPPEGAV